MEEIGSKYQSMMEDRGSIYLGEKTRRTIEKLLGNKETKDLNNDELENVATQAINDFHEYLKKSGMNQLQIRMIMMSHATDTETILDVLKQLFSV